MLLHELPAYMEDGRLRVVVEVPRGSASKFKYDPATGTFSLHRSLPKGLSFPFAYGFIPRTTGDDGDPLDGLVFADTETFSGCVVPTRLVGVIQATQKKESGGRGGNDILLAVHTESVTWGHVRGVADFPTELLREIEFFFSSYRNFQGKDFRVTGRAGPAAARKLVKDGMALFQHEAP